MLEQTSSRPLWLTAFLVPVDGEGPCQLVRIQENSHAISDVIGGSAFDEVVSGHIAGQIFVMYAADAGGARNTRAGIIAARLGYHARDVMRRLSGAVLIVGQHPCGAWDVDVPVAVVALAAASGVAVLFPGHGGEQGPTSPRCETDDR